MKKRFDPFKPRNPLSYGHLINFLDNLGINPELRKY